MKKVVLVKSALCLVTALTLIAATHAPKLTSATLSTETGLAGISLSLDKYYSVENIDAKVETKVLTAQTTNDVQGIEEPEATVEPVSEYADTGISIAADYVNIRKKPNTESEILGKLYKGSAAKIVETDGEWVKIKSGSVEGYINSEFLAIGFSAEELVDKYGTKWATVNTTTLKVREEKNTDSTVLTLVPLGEEFKVIKEYKDWVKILIDDGEGSEATAGFVSKEYVDIRVTFKHAISIEEEKAKEKAKEEARKAEEEAAAKLAAAEEAKRNESNHSSNNSSNNNSSSNKDNSSDSGQVVGSGSGAEIAAFALKFVGNPYVYGGTSLTNGADCSGFVQSVFKAFGISLPRTSSAQSGVGKKISVDEARAGDLIFYGNNGSVGHVALCIGGGQVVHASNPETGIKVSNIYYRTPYGARRVIE